MVSTGVIILGIIVVVVVLGLGTGVINLQSLNIGQPAGNGGIQTSPDGTPSTGQGFTGQLTVNVEHRDALDNAETRTEGADLRTNYYKSTDGVTFSSIGTGSGIILTIDSAMNSILYFTSVPIDPFFVAPSSTSDPNLNPRIIDFGFMDVNNDGTREWWFKMDLRDIPAPVAGQTASTLSLFINSYDDGVSTLNAPINIVNVGSNAGTVTFVRWEQTVAQETVDPVYEYTILIDKVTGAGGTEFWELGQSNLDIPNIGVVSLADFDEQILTSTTVLYRWKVGETATLDNANYVTTAQNGNAVHPIPFKIVTNLSDNSFNDNLDVTLTLKSLTPNQGTVSVSDTVRLDES